MLGITLYFNSVFLSNCWRLWKYDRMRMTLFFALLQVSLQLEPTPLTHLVDVTIVHP